MNDACIGKIDDGEFFFLIIFWIDCPAGCSECSNESTCHSCIDGYSLTESSICDNREKAAGRVFVGIGAFLLLILSLLLWELYRAVSTFIEVTKLYEKEVFYINKII